MEFAAQFDLEALWGPLAVPRADEPILQDWIGNRWPQGSLPFLPGIDWRGPDRPTESDGFRAGAVEWLAFALALRWAAAGDLPATAIEMGASQGPWCLSWVRCARRLALGIPAVAVGYEGSDAMAATEAFWSAQGLPHAVRKQTDELVLEGDRWSFTWRRQAIAPGGGEVLFPAIDVRADNGAQARRDVSPTDYRGRALDHVSVPAVDPSDAVREHEHVHFLHVDVQGGELDLLRSGSLAELGDHVGVLMLGTHSRTAEGLAFETLPDAGFHLLAEDPVQYDLMAGQRPLLYRDGEQLWVANAALATLQDVGLVRRA